MYKYNNLLKNVWKHQINVITYLLIYINTLAGDYSWKLALEAKAALFIKKGLSSSL